MRRRLGKGWGGVGGLFASAAAWIRSSRWRLGQERSSKLRGPLACSFGHARASSQQILLITSHGER
jgi:hypothetical protein